MKYRSLDSTKVVDTIALLGKRIEERFPASKLKVVCDELHEIAKESQAKSEWIGRPQYGLRFAIGFVIVLGISALVFSFSLMDVELTEFSLNDLIIYIEAAVNDLIFIGIAIFFLVTIELRVKRRRALIALRELRSIAHVIDLHQLTKDPHRVKGPRLPTPSSPVDQMSVFELSRYLDYCSEMLSLTGKVAALYGQQLGDSVVTAAVNEVETLTTGLSQKVWQKLIVLQQPDVDE